MAGPKPKARRVAAKAKAKEAPEKPQRERFIEAARAIGVDETGAEFERALAKIVPPKAVRTKQSPRLKRG